MIIKKISTLLVCGSVLASMASNVSAEVPKGAHFHVGAQTAHHKYLDKRLSGWNGGADFGAAYHFSNHFFLDSNIHYSRGALHGKNKNTGVKVKVDSSRWDVRAVSGYHFDVNKDFCLSPYLGVGFDRYGLTNKKYKFDMGAMYMPIGVKATFNIIPKSFDFTISAEYDYYFSGKAHSKTYDANMEKVVSNPLPKIKAGDLHGFRVDMMFANKFANGTAVSYGPYINHMQGKKINKEAKFKEIGAKIKFHF